MSFARDSGSAMTNKERSMEKGNEEGFCHSD
jgi:hypothetical protein